MPYLKSTAVWVRGVFDQARGDEYGVGGREAVRQCNVKGSDANSVVAAEQLNAIHALFRPAIDVLMVCVEKNLSPEDRMRRGRGAHRKVAGVPHSEICRVLGYLLTFDQLLIPAGLSSLWT